jgi:hypothetical protein
MVKWLNSLDPLPASLMIRPFAEWRARYTTYLKQRGMYRQGTTFRMDREQRPCVTSRDSHYISTLRQVHSILENAYDDRPEHEKDVWNLQRMVPISLSLSNVTLSFHRIQNGEGWSNPEFPRGNLRAVDPCVVAKWLRTQ